MTFNPVHLQTKENGVFLIDPSMDSARKILE